MRPEQFYQEIGGSYQEALTRMLDDRRIVRYLGMFLQDTSMEELGKALTAGDAEEAFRMAHALKGTCLTLGLGRLTVRASELTEMLRTETGTETNSQALLEEILTQREKLLQLRDET